MIKFPPPTALPKAPEHDDARARREPGRDFAGWLAPPAQSGIPADTKGPTPQAPGAVADVAPHASSRRDLAALLATNEPPNPGLLMSNLSARADAMPVRADVEAVAQRVLDVLAAIAPGHVDAQHLMPSVEGHGHRELADDVVLPWRLQANAGLSYLSAPGLDVPVADFVAGSSLPGGFGARVGAGASTVPAMQVPAGDAATALHRGALEWTSYLADQNFGGVEREQRMERLQRWLAGHTDWPERLLRWFGNDADITAWVRDFQLGEADLPALVQKLREYAQVHGRPLTRVMHNGREVWSARHHDNTNGSES
jgi:hypothetical protein